MSLPCPVPILVSKGRPFEQALAQALISQDQGVATELQGRLADIRPPTGDTDLSVVAWQGACFVYCASNRIPVKLLHKNPRSTEGGVDIQEAAFAVSLATGAQSGGRRSPGAPPAECPGQRGCRLRRPG